MAHSIGFERTAVLILCSALASTSFAQTPAYADSNYVRADAGDHVRKFIQYWFARELRGAHERPLALALPASATDVYRMTVLGNAGGVSVIRVEQRDGQWIVVRTDTRPGTSDWRNAKRILVRTDSVIVVGSRVSALIRVIEKTHYWREPAPNCRHGFDGWELFLEARTSDGYSSSFCWAPDRETAPALIDTMNEFNRLEEELFPREAPRAR